MKIKKEIAKIAVSLSLVLALPIGLVLGATTSTNSFSDVSSTSPYYTAIMDLKARGIISGYSDGTFKPDQMVNRVEALKIILLGTNFKPQTASPNTPTPTFSDIDKTEWYMPYLTEAYNGQIVSGYPDGTFKPTQTVNLVENLKMLINTKKISLDKINVTSDPFADASMSQWYTRYVEYAKENNWISGDSKNMIYPAQGMSRGKLAQLLYNSLKNTTPNLPVTTQTQQTEQNVQNPPIWNTSDALVVNIQGMQFIKNSMVVPQGGKVMWINKDSIAHTVTSDDGTFTSSATIAPGQSYIYIFNNIGTFNYHCSIHPTMKGSIVVKPAIEVPTI